MANMFLNIINSVILRQYVVVITLNLTVLSIGIGLAWPSPMLVKLRNSTQTVLDEPISDKAGSWVVSIGFLVGGLLNSVSSLPLDRIGRKYTVVLAMIPKLVGSSFMLFANQVWMLILGRVLNGISDQLLFATVPLYASEMANKEIRGALTTILQIMCSLGIVVMLSVGPFVSYIAGNILHVAVITAALMPVFFLPESPYFLYLKGRTDDSRKVLTTLRGSENIADEQLKEYTDARKEINKLELFRNRTFQKSLALVAMLIIGAQMVGFNAVSYYLQTILESTKTSVQPELASVIIGIIQLSASVFTTAITDRFGRKPILCSTLIGMMLGMIGLGFFFYKTNATNVIGFMNYLPLISLILVVFCYSAGSGSLNWAVSAELFDNDGRAVGLSISMMLAGVSTFFLTKFFPSLMANIGPTATYWGFSVMCLLFCGFIFVLIPETKGKTFAEIQTALGVKVDVDEEKSVK